MCCDGWNDSKLANGRCESCDEPTIDGVAAVGCYWSPEICEDCGSRPCDESC
jgi:hypothetical protein